MTAPFVPRMVVSRFMMDVLGTDPDVIAALEAGNPPGIIVPDEAIPTPEVMTLAQTFGGGISVAKRLGNPIARVEMYWDLTGWDPSYMRGMNEPLMLAVMKVLLGPETKGTKRVWLDEEDNRRWYVEVDFVSEDAVPLDTTNPQVWAPIRHRYRVAIIPRD